MKKGYWVAHVTGLLEAEYVRQFIISRAIADRATAMGGI